MTNRAYGWLPESGYFDLWGTAPYVPDRWRAQLDQRLHQLRTRFDGSFRLSAHHRHWLKHHLDDWDVDQTAAGLDRIAPGWRAGWDEERIDQARLAVALLPDLTQLASQGIAWWAHPRTLTTLGVLMRGADAMGDHVRTALAEVVPARLWARNRQGLIDSLDAAGLLAPAPSESARVRFVTDRGEYYPRPSLSSSTAPRGDAVEVEVTYTRPFPPLDSRMLDGLLHRPRLWLREVGYESWEVKCLPDSRRRDRLLWYIDGGTTDAWVYRGLGFTENEAEALMPWREAADSILLTEFAGREWTHSHLIHSALLRGDTAIDISHGPGPTATVTLTVNRVPEAIAPPPGITLGCRSRTVSFRAAERLWRDEAGLTGMIYTLTDDDAEIIANDPNGRPYHAWDNDRDRGRGDEAHLPMEGLARHVAREHLRDITADDGVRRILYAHVFALLGLPHAQSRVALPA